MRVNYSIIFVSDMERSVSFYRDVLELPLKFETSHWTEFATEGVTIALHLSDEPADDQPQQSHTTAGHCRAGFCVKDLDAFHRRMADNNVECIQESRETFGTRIAQYLDPDGLVFSVSGESADQARPG